MQQYINQEDKKTAEDIINKIIGKMVISDIRVTGMDKLGFTATIRLDSVDLFFTYYSEDCWKIETFPVAAISGSCKRSVEIF